MFTRPVIEIRIFRNARTTQREVETQESSKSKEQRVKGSKKRTLNFYELTKPKHFTYVI